MKETVPNVLAWTFCLDGCFTVRSFRKRLEESSTNSAFDFNLIWQGICPAKIEIFGWQLLRGRVMVRQVLRKFGFDPAYSLMCPFCNAAEESVDHLFLLCPWSWKLWNRCMSWWEVGSCINDSLKN
ncbi:hypothetical protein Dsin_013549 [Dipteronia sinensis]|uniref:Reverse transcriptase zinc-binding domain-containing protein n=1 Tax=Dipteronia sinensis TaxID=43782 RepID=A0AAE0E976_9ROSI|nr:hypothetical protein Dsin_013549 [Dipteronia sinensis]